jgi:hypothetical protein
MSNNECGISGCICVSGISVVYVFRPLWQLYSKEARAFKEHVV